MKIKSLSPKDSEHLTNDIKWEYLYKIIWNYTLGLTL